MATEARDLVAKAERIGSLVREHAHEGEVAGTLAPDVVEALRDGGLFSILVPKELGGPEVDVATMVRVIEAVSVGDGAAGWCVMISATTGSAACVLPREGAEEVFGDLRSAAGGVVMPPARAVRVEGGYRVTGRWAFGSGGPHASWMLGGALVHGPEGPEMLAENVPHLRMMFFPREAITFHPTWQVSGLRGTGSNDFEVNDLFVPERHATSRAPGAQWSNGPIFQVPMFGLLAIGVASVALGIGRAAIEELKQLAVGKTPTGSRRPLAERGAAQSGIAEAEALVRSGRAFMFETLSDVWTRLNAGERMTQDDRMLLRLSATTAAVNCARAVDICYNLGGASSIYDTSPLQRQFRDIHTLTQHVMVGQPTLEVAGRIMFGVPTDTSMF